MHFILKIQKSLRELNHNSSNKERRKLWVIMMAKVTTDQQTKDGVQIPPTITTVMADTNNH